jgi:hypothetical protein
MTAVPELDRQPRRSARRVLTAVEFDVLWEWLGLGATPVVLRLDSPGRTHAERWRIVAAGWAGLRQRGLADLAGPDPEVVRLMHLLAVPSTQVELRMRRDPMSRQRGRIPGDGARGRVVDTELRVVAAGGPGSTALAVRRDETVTLSSAPGPVSGVLSVLPPLRAGRGPAVTLPSTDLDAATGEPAGGRPMAEVLVDRGVDPEDAELVEALVRGAVRRGQLSALAADQWGVLHRLPKVIGVLDTRHGRYLMHRDTAPDGVEWTSLAPADPHRLHTRLDVLLAEAEVAATRT